MAVANRIKKSLFRLRWRIMSRQGRIAALSANRITMEELRKRRFDLGQLHEVRLAELLRS